MRKVIAEITVNPYDLAENAKELHRLLDNVRDYVRVIDKSRLSLLQRTNTGALPELDLSELHGIAYLLEDIAEQGKQQ